MELAKNKKAYFDYTILKSLEAGLILRGYEVKAVKKRQVNLKNSYVTIHKNRLGITGMHISKYKPAGYLENYDPNNWREILLHKKQISYLQSKMQEKGLTIIPLKVYTKNRLVKVEIGICKGKKQFDKREIIKKRDLDRKLRKILKI